MATHPNEDFTKCPTCNKKMEYGEILQRSYEFGPDHEGMVLNQHTETIVEVLDSWVECSKHGKWGLSNDQYTELDW